MQVQIGVSAVIVKGKEFLALKRSEKEEFGKEGSWTLPCGRVEDYEDPNVAILREIKEETGLDVKAIKPIDVWNGKNADVWRIVICYLCEYEKGKVKLSSEHTDYEWVSLNAKDEKFEEWILHHARKAMKEIKT